MKLSEDLAWRGLIKDKTFSDDKWLDEPKVFYHGVDASSDSMTIGNLAAMLMSRRLLEAGWKAVLLAGGATSLVGDPGGKEEERELQPREVIEKNVEAIKSQIDKLFSGKEFTLVDNYDWFKDVRYLEFLRDVGKHYSMSELMQREFVTERMGEGGSGISYAEFSYSLIQGYDYWQLFKNHGCVLQIGGSDQWGNMLSGVPLIRKKEGAEVHALSMPLVVNKSTGRKFGKSEDGAVWLDPAKTTPNQFYQFWINADDADVEDYLKVFTLLSKEEIEKLMAENKQKPSDRQAQVKLAEEVTKLVHGEEELSKITVITDLFTGKIKVEDVSEEQIGYIRNQINVPKLQPGTNIIEALVKSGLASSNSDARRVKDSGGVYVNGEQFDKDHLESADFKNGRLMLRRGKAFKDSALIELT
jgi:tyrosyl-tRNA synthetase